ncbi:MAG: hypothetical protein M0P69_06400, partial [Bacteroidales bacterium]|nr:hypothetical protein [Bacteroidales bacterium]
MAWYDDNKDWAKEAVAQAISLLDQEQSELVELTKKAADMGIGTGAIIGGLLGAGLGHKTIDAKKDMEYRNLYGNTIQRVLNEQNRKLVEMSDDHYQQIDNLAEDLKIIFTPFSVVYMLRGTAVDTISVSTMNASMKQAWRNKDVTYFKNLLVNKAYLEAQEAEQMFIKRLIEQDGFLKGAIKKNSADYTLVDEDTESDLHLFTVMDKVAYLQKLFVKAGESDVLAKYANTLTTIGCTWDDVNIPIEVGAYRYASDLDYDLGMQKLSFLWFSNPKSTIETDVITPDRIKRDLSIVYLPDRILFVTDDIVLSQLNVMGMNEEGYDRFQRKDSKFFRRNFLDEAKHAGYDTDEELQKLAVEDDDFEDLNSRVSKMSSELREASGYTKVSGDPENPTTGMPEAEAEKLAAASPELADQNPLMKELFTKPGIHPKVYYLALMKEFGSDWLEWDLDTLIAMIDDNFGVNPIADIPLNKLGSIVVLMHSDAPYTGFHTFEKVIRSFHDKPINFELRESNISLGEIVTGIRMMGELIRDNDDNIYDNFSEHVLGYMVEVLHSRNYRACVPKTISKNETLFWKLVNIEL